MSSELTSKPNKERAVLVMMPLLVLHLALLSIQIESPSGTLLIKKWTLAAQSPILSLSSNIKYGIKSVWHNYIWMVGTRAENEQLQRTVHHLMQVNSSLEQSQRENERLRRLLSLNEELALESVGARVIARTPAFLSNLIYINRGSEDGVQVNAAVFCAKGIVGRTVLVARNQSQVQLITNPDASIGAILERTRTPGVLRGTGDTVLDMIYIGNAERVEVGDEVLSSGLDGIYPKGLRIGKVVDSHKGKGVFRIIKVEPQMDLIRLEEVSVLLEDPKPEEKKEP